MTIKYGLLCDYASVDIGGKNNYIGVFQNININKQDNPDCLSPTFFAGVHITDATVGSYNLKLKIQSPNSAKDSIEVATGIFTLTPENMPEDATVSIILPIKPVKLDSPGMWGLKLEINGKDQDLTSLRVKYV